MAAVRLFLLPCSKRTLSFAVGIAFSLNELPCGTTLFVALDVYGLDITQLLDVEVVRLDETSIERSEHA